jgi:hypothetical protein
MVSSGMLRHVALVRTDVSEELNAVLSLCQLLITASVVPSSKILVTLMKKVLVPPKCRILQEPNGVTSQKTQFFIVTAVKTSNLTKTLARCNIVSKFPIVTQQFSPCYINLESFFFF